MELETVLLLRFLAVIFLACLLAPWLVWRLRSRLGWAVRVIDWVAGW